MHPPPPLNSPIKQSMVTKLCITAEADAHAAERGEGGARGLGVFVPRPRHAAKAAPRQRVSHRQRDEPQRRRKVGLDRGARNKGRGGRHVQGARRNIAPLLLLRVHRLGRFVVDLTVAAVVGLAGLILDIVILGLITTAGDSAARIFGGVIVDPLGDRLAE
jgi:hypothetical protein